MFVTRAIINSNITLPPEFMNQSVREQNASYAYLYEALTRYFLKWYLPLVISLGYIGSVFCMVFLTRSKMFPKNMRIWLISICIGDFLILTMEGIWMLLKVWYKFDIRDVNDTLCIVHISLSNYLFYWSAYVQCFVSMQRCYLVLKPLQVNSRLLSPRILLLCLLLVSVLLTIPILPYAVYWRLVNGDCDPINDDIFRLTTVFDLVFWGLIPSTLMATSTVIIWRNLLHRRNVFDALGNFKQSSNMTEIALVSTGTNAAKPSIKRHSVALCRMQIHPETKGRSKSVVKCTVPQGNFSPAKRASVFGLLPGRNISATESSKRRATSDSNSHVTVVLICMNFVYLTSVYPLIIYFICLNFVFDSLDKDIHRFIYYLFRSFCFLNACTNWIFYCVAGSTFRKRTRHLARLVCCRPCVSGRRLRIVDPLPPSTSNGSSYRKRYSCSVYQNLGVGVTNPSGSMSSNEQTRLTRVDVEQVRQNDAG